MSTREINLPGPLVLIYSQKFAAALGNGLTPFVAELNKLASQGVLPATLEQTDTGWRMALHTTRHVAWLYPTQAGDAYNLGHGAPRKFRDEERLVKGALLVRSARGFLAYPDLRTYNQSTQGMPLPRTNYAQQLWHLWGALGLGDRSPAAPPPKHARQLDLLETVVEASRQIEIDRQAAVPPQHYLSRTDAKEQRYSARGVYRFRMAARGDLTNKSMVALGEEPHFRGRVIRVDGRDVTVRFEPGADFDRIRRQGTLRVLPSDRVYRAQLDAIALLRKGESRNPKLLDCLIGAEFLPYRPVSKAVPETRLDPADGQLEAFHRAIDVPDVLCVLGPPGTGKTTTITEVVKACAKAGQRVLITSHTHRAVDNVLEKLPSELNLVRIGNEDNMKSEVKALSSESRAETARAEILADSALYDRLTEIRRQRSLAERILEHLYSQWQTGEAARRELDRIGAALIEAVKRASASLRAPIEEAERDVARHGKKVAALENSLVRAESRRESATEKAHSGAGLAFLHRWMAGRQERRGDRLRQQLPQAVQAGDAAAETLRDLVGRAEAMAGGDPAVNELKAARAKARATIAACVAEMTPGAGVLRQILAPFTSLPAVPGGDIGQWREFHLSAHESLDRACRRAELLRQWRERISDLSAELEREIVCYADVVGATCIGTDTSALISDLEFDLAIVDEAGQISTPNLLVPLVRSKRAMLVGDHMQLPPFLDEEVRRWAQDNPAASSVQALLAQSGFELLFPKAPPSNAVWLRKQRRMPRQIGEFVSATFYDKHLHTEHAGCDPDSIFRSPLAFVDTSDRPWPRRRETSMSGLGEAIRHGYRNELEADLITRLIVAYQERYRDWAVIVPFNAQKELIIERLGTVLGASSQVADNVGSVDSFQGGERDLIVFGFTRSNPNGDIGFLRETRRFNVAVTRARKQLVLVGDLETLRNAKHDGFRTVVRLLCDHLSRAGDLRPSLAVDEVKVP